MSDHDHRTDLKSSHSPDGPLPFQPGGEYGSAYFPDESTQQMEKAGWIVFWLCFIPILGGFFSLATIVLGIILLTRNRMYPGLMFLIVGPIANAVTTLAFFLIFMAGIFGVAASQSGVIR